MKENTFLKFLRRNGAFLVLVLIFVAVATAAPGILRWRAMNSLLQDNAPLLMLIVGATLPILLGCLDLSIAAMASLAAVVAAMLSPAASPRPWRKPPRAVRNPSCWRPRCGLRCPGKLFRKSMVWSRSFRF